MMLGVPVRVLAPVPFRVRVWLLLFVFLLELVIVFCVSVPSVEMLHLQHHG